MRVIFKLGFEGYKCFKYEELGGGGGEGRKLSLFRVGKGILGKGNSMSWCIEVVWG